MIAIKYLIMEIDLKHKKAAKTNSVTQGEQAANLWKPLMESGVHIDFAC